MWTPIRGCATIGVGVDRVHKRKRAPAGGGVVSEPRNIVLYAVLTVVTCGLWALVWVYQLGGDIQTLRGDDKPNILMDFLLTLLTCGIWGIYVAYQWPLLLQEPARARGIHVDNNLPVISLVLYFFGFAFVSLILVQSVANQALTQAAEV